MRIQTRKIAIIGAGHVCSHAGYSLLSQGLADELVYIDVDEKKARAQAMDLSDATKYLPTRARVYAGGYADIADAQLLIVAASIAEVVRAIVHDEDRILPVSVLLDGEYGQHDVYASVPARLNADGVADVIELALTPEEQERFAASCRTMTENYQLSLTL